MNSVIDVSQFNGTVNWPAVTADAAILRLGYRGYGKAGTLVTDSKFEVNYAGATAAGIPVGVYWLSQATSDAEATAEAKYVVDRLAGKRITYPVYLDSEYSNNSHTGRADYISKARRTQYAVTFLEAIQAAGYTAGVYASESWFKDMLDVSLLTDYSLWAAKYSRIPPSIGVSYDGWQYTDKATPAGLAGNTDMSTFYRDFAAENAAKATTEENNGEEFNMDITEARKQLTSCTDTGDTPSGWAQEATEYCKRKGIFNGDGAGNYGWQQPITREAVACILYRAFEAAGMLDALPDAN